MSEQFVFPEITLLITHYNRSHSLERLLESFSEFGCRFATIIVSDDGSQPEHLLRLKQLQSFYLFELATTPQNRGLGNNINKGQDLVKTPYTLYVQEDFIPTELFPTKLIESLDFMIKDPALDIVRYYAYFKYPYLRPFACGFSEMLFHITKPGYSKFYMYSDHPHLRRSSYFSKFGRYSEGRKADVTEYKMMISFLSNKGKALFFEEYKSLFIQKNSSEEPSTIKRNIFRESNNFVITWARHFYRHLKFNSDYMFHKQQ